LEHTVIQKYFFLEIPINVKAGRVKRAPGKYIAGAALDRPDLESSTEANHIRTKRLIECGYLFVEMSVIVEDESVIL
jgi:hypothetical protein